MYGFQVFSKIACKKFVYKQCNISVSFGCSSIWSSFAAGNVRVLYSGSMPLDVSRLHHSNHVFESDVIAIDIKQYRGS